MHTNTKIIATLASIVLSLPLIAQNGNNGSNQNGNYGNNGNRNERNQDRNNRDNQNADYRERI